MAGHTCGRRPAALLFRVREQALARLPAQTLGRRAHAQSGGVAEWLKAHAWKACLRVTVTRVRIPLPPPTAFASLRRDWLADHDVALEKRMPRRIPPEPHAPRLSASSAVHLVTPAQRLRPYTCRTATADAGCRADEICPGGHPVASRAQHHAQQDLIAKRCKDGGGAYNVMTILTLIRANSRISWHGEITLNGTSALA